jgi:thiamine biosynthesis protein ThiS
MKIILNGEPRETAEAITIAALLEQLNLAPQRVAVEVNLDVIPRDQHARRVLKDGDRLEIVTLVGGG